MVREGLVVKIELPGYIEERLPNGKMRRRVRMEGNPKRRFPIPVAPDSPDFMEYYHAGRAGVAATPSSTPIERAIPQSISWLTLKHLAHLEEEVKRGLKSPHTLKKRELLFKELRDECGEYPMMMPTSAIVNFRNSLSDRPAWADSMVEAIRGMYRWAVETGIANHNPAVGVGRINPGGDGAESWKEPQLQQFRAHYPEGTQQHLVLTLLLFSAARISDVILLGADHEVVRDDVVHLKFQPVKKGSAEVDIPMTKSLYRVTRPFAKTGQPYVLSSKGKPYSTPDSLGGLFRRWCADAGLPGLSAHGVRKSVGEILAEEHCSQYEIMAVHGHKEARTSETYTKKVRRRILAASAAAKLEGIDW